MHEEHEKEHHHHHDHDHDHEEHEHHHEHHHEHEEHAHHHDHEHHHHHDADEIFTSVGIETAARYTKDEITNILKELGHEDEYGMVIRAKGMVAGEDSWIYFDYTPGETDVRSGSPDVTGRVCVIGAELKEDQVRKLFR